jgi:hypothetical protein
MINPWLDASIVGALASVVSFLKACRELRMGWRRVCGGSDGRWRIERYGD